MKIYFVSGFLGSGKTTSIINAGRILMRNGRRIGVVTNDQGKYLVDNYFVNESGVPSVEVANGCFCCNYDDFDTRILDLAENEKPDIIFAESVGSCADIVATVMKPLREFRANYAIESSLSAFADARLLKARLSGGKLPFSDDVIYIFDKQIEEADILVINKRDLFSEEDGRRLAEQASERFPDKRLLFQSAFSDDDLENWLAGAETASAYPHNHATIDMDYGRYASGELKMAWLDRLFSIESEAGDLCIPVQRLFNSIGEELQKAGMSVGHLKLFIKPAEFPALKISLTGMDGAEPQKLPERMGHKARIVLNARVETEPALLEKIVNESIASVCGEFGLKETLIEENSFRPGKPEPVHRFV